MTSLRLLVCLAIGAITSYANGATVIYDLTGSRGEERPLLFYYIAPDFIRSDTIVSSPAIWSCLAPIGSVCQSIHFEPVNTEGLIASRLAYSYLRFPTATSLGST